MKPLILLLLSLTTFASERRDYLLANHNELPPISWVNTKNWKLYYVHSRGGFAFSLDTLKNFQNVPLNQDSMGVFLKGVTEIPVDRTPVWMGYYVASCQLPDGLPIKIEISQYGRFFYEERTKRYFQLSENLQTDWLAYLTAKWKTLENVSE